MSAIIRKDSSLEASFKAYAILSEKLFMNSKQCLKFLFIFISFTSLISISSCGQVDRNLENEAARLSEAAKAHDQDDEKKSNVEILCPFVYMPVCGQPPMPVCPPGYSCPQVMPQIKTYSNSCELSREGAELLYQGECQ